MQANKWLLKILRWCVFAIFAACVLFAFASAPIQRPQTPDVKQSTNIAWVQVINEQLIPIETVADTIPVQAGETMVFEATLVGVHNQDVVVFRSKNQEVRVWIDEVEVYQFLMQEDFTFLQSPGSVWNEVTLDAHMEGATIRVELTAATTYFSDLFYDFHLVHESKVLSLKARYLWLQVLAGVFLVVMAIISYLNGKLWRGTQMRSYVIHLADFYLVLGVYILAKAGIFTLVFNRPLVSYFAEALALRIVPIVAYRFVFNLLNRHYRIVDVFGLCVWAHFFISVAVQFICGVSFLDTLWLAHAFLVMGAVIDFVMCAWHLHRTRQEKSKRNYLFLSTSILFASAVCEVFRFYFLPKNDSMIGLFIMVGYFLYTIVDHFIIVYRNAALNRDSVAMQTRYDKLQNSTLMQQINAHFFFNTLNTISALCKEDVEKADEAVTLLSKYMRHYMYFLKTESNISFLDELDLVQVYLAIEKMRFEGDFSVRTDIVFTDFNLPPLSVQPLVENAVVHGLRSHNQFGQLSISSKREGAYAVVTITDDGAGFDCSVIEQKKSLAINNIRTRLQTIVDGTLEIKSEAGKGTIVKVKVPL